MTHKEFTYWLSGFLNGKKALSEEEVAEINKQLALAADYPSYIWNQWAKLPHTGDWGQNVQLLDNQPLQFSTNIDVAGINVPFVAGT